ncbi:MAG: 5'-deoxynucleotidase [Lachnospiraceae bacterium]|uniref:5'-deoxynucleotidase n=1 Tax=Candidatus Weimeria bifida TaxID=2599074 RepID=A0A6N7IZW1_9FIRM|nr:5'-deoxynucleotidase [Candidatus Weimeria bifida]RRF95104.1 MAG: 5'-deoxynucleotidase [Lachnospiraceae bacterium]
MSETSTFFAAIARMKYIERWALMHCARPESLSEHSLEVAMIAHALCVIGNKRYGKNLNAEKAALIGLYHDASEVITGDMPTPVKYANEDLKTAYKSMEHQAELTLLNKLPSDLVESYRDIVCEEAPAGSGEDEKYMRRLVKAADKLSAYIKCIEEEKAGNCEFKTAKASTRAKVDALRSELPELNDFMQDMLPPYGETLDELI